MNRIGRKLQQDTGWREGRDQNVDVHDHPVVEATAVEIENSEGRHGIRVDVR